MLAAGAAELLAQAEAQSTVGGAGARP